MMLIRYVFIAGLALMAVSLVSILWPTMSKSPRPPILESVYSFVSKTPAGSQATMVLGVTTDGKPPTLQEIGTRLVSEAVDKSKQEVAKIIVASAVKQLYGQYNSLAPDQKQVLQAMICQPASSSSEIQVSQ